jgi:hypothetical protein
MERKKPVFERNSQPAAEEAQQPDVIINRLINDTFRPTEAQKRAKAALLASLADPSNTILDARSISLATALKLTGITTLRGWWDQPGFQHWFMNKEETKQKIKYLTDKALESVTQILDDPDPRTSSAKVAILKTLLQYEAAEVQTKTNTRFDSMDIVQLRAFLKQNAHLIRPLLEETKPATVSAEEQGADEDDNNY